MAIRFGAGLFKPPDSPVDFSASAGTYLLLGIFLAALPNTRIDWAARDTPCRRVSACGRRAIRSHGLLVRAHSAVVFERVAHAVGDLLGGNDRGAAVGAEFVAARDAGGLLRVLSVIRERGEGLFELSVGWDVAGGRIHFAVLCTGGAAAPLGRG